MENRAERLNSLLVQLFNDILHIEEKVLKSSEIKDLSITEMHTIDAIGTQGNRTMGEIAHDLRITVGTLTSAINRLIKISVNLANRLSCKLDLHHKESVCNCRKTGQFQRLVPLRCHFQNHLQSLETHS